MAAAARYGVPRATHAARSLAWQDDKHTTGWPTKERTVLLLANGQKAAASRRARRGHTISITSLKISSVPCQCQINLSQRQHACAKTSNVRHGALGCGRRKAAPGPPAGRPASVSRPRGRAGEQAAIPTATEFPAAWPAPAPASPDGSKGRLERLPHVDRPPGCRYPGRWPLAVRRGQDPRFARDPHCISRGVDLTS